MTEAAKKVNRLSQETSPYLKQHQYNPVDWYPWGGEAFEAARSSGKVIFLSIGYSTCYWCHVMEKDSFEDESTARILNDDFISIKVDREERPDVDQLYMDALVALTGHGGWPMSVFLTPDLKPFFAGTFFYNRQFKDILGRISEIWASQRLDVLESAGKITSFLSQELSEEPIAVSQELLKDAFLNLGESYDAINGGFGGAPKFPPSQQVSLLLRIHRRSGQDYALQMALKTLEKMARGGIYDHLGGGFHRYSVDERWQIPHFEKMLYDNALLVVSYVEACEASKNSFYGEVARGISSYLMREMVSEEGAFFTAQDAGDVGKEGEYYAWDWEEVVSTLSDEAERALFLSAYNLSKDGNFEGKNVLHLHESQEWQIKAQPLLVSASKKLLAVRNSRPSPHTDKKIITAWNALTVTAMARMHRLFNEEKYLEAAKNCAGFIKANLFIERRLFRSFCEGKAVHDGCLEDYAFLVEALIELYQADFNVEHISWAKELQEIQDDLFWDREKGGYFFSSGPELIVRKKDYLDGATPSGNSVALSNLLKLYDLLGDNDLREKSSRLLEIYSPYIKRHPPSFSKALQAVDRVTDLSRTVACIVADDSGNVGDFLKLKNSAFLPNTLLAVGKTPQDARVVEILSHKNFSRNLYYVCEERTCREPVEDPGKAYKMCLEFRPIKF